MRTFTYAGPDGVELPGHWSAEWLVLDGCDGDLDTPPDVTDEDGLLLRVELRPAGGEPWWLGLPLGEHELATVAHGLFPLPGTERLLVALGQRAWVVQPAVRGSAELAEVVGRTSPASSRASRSWPLSHPHALAGSAPRASTGASSRTGSSRSRSSTCTTTCCTASGCWGARRSRCGSPPGGASCWTSTDPIAARRRCSGSAGGDFVLHDGERRRGEARFDARRWARCASPSVYGV